MLCRVVRVCVVQVMLALYMALLLAAVCMLGELMLFHLVLISRGMSTYDFIVAQREEMYAGGGHGTPQQLSDAASVALLFWRLLTCQGCNAGDNRVHNEALGAAAGGSRGRPQVSLNPCAACTSEKIDGAASEWLRRQGAATSEKASTPDAFKDKPFVTQPSTKSDASSSELIKASLHRQEAGPLPEHCVRASGSGSAVGLAGVAQALPWSPHQIAKAYGYGSTAVSPSAGATQAAGSSSPHRPPPWPVSSASPAAASPASGYPQPQPAYDTAALRSSFHTQGAPVPPLPPTGAELPVTPGASPASGLGFSSARHLHSSPSLKQSIEQRLSAGQGIVGAQLPPLRPPAAAVTLQQPSQQPGQPSVPVYTAAAYQAHQSPTQLPSPYSYNRSSPERVSYNSYNSQNATNVYTGQQTGVGSPHGAYSQHGSPVPRSPHGAMSGDQSGNVLYVGGHASQQSSLNRDTAGPHAGEHS